MLELPEALILFIWNELQMKSSLWQKIPQLFTLKDFFWYPLNYPLPHIANSALPVHK
jgi:hypothetical protein